MPISRNFCGRLLGLIVLANTCASAAASEPFVPKSAVEHDSVVAGSSQDFMEVRHLVLRGSNEEIGKALATIAKERFHVKPAPSRDPLRARVQRRYVEKNYPILAERMRGVAAAYGLKATDNNWNLDGLWYFAGLKAGCSVVYYPPAVTTSGAGILSRNYDFSTGAITGERPPEGELPATARPHVIEMYPDRGYASLAIYAYDLLSGVMDGINAEGLTVSLLADDELSAKFPMEPSGSEAVGLGVAQVLRMLLDTCATAEDAKEALLMTKQHYEFIPVHYLIADRHGHAFVWEYSHAHNREYIVENPGRPLITTNFSLHRYLERNGPPSAAKTKTVCPRYCALAERIADHSGQWTADAILKLHQVVDAVQLTRKNAKRPPGRTLWHALYFPSEQKVRVSFFLRDDIGASDAAKNRIVRSDYVEFALKKSTANKK